MSAVCINREKAKTSLNFVSVRADFDIHQEKTARTTEFYVLFYT